MMLCKRTCSHVMVVASLMLAGCSNEFPGRGQPIDAASMPPVQALVEPDIPPAVAGEQGWDYVQRAVVDLDGDGEQEQAVLTARVEMVDGRPAWDDGQPWQVYVEEPGGERTHVYARRLQLGTLTLRLGRAAPAEPPMILLIEHLPDRLALYEISYERPGRAEVTERFLRDLEPSGDIAAPRFP